MTLVLERRNWAVMLLALCATLAGPAGYAIAQEEGEDAPAAAETAEEPAAEEPAEEEAAAEEAGSTDPADPLAYAFDSAILFLCAVLVFFMQAGFAMVEVGLQLVEERREHHVQERRWTSASAFCCSSSSDSA